MTSVFSVSQKCKHVYVSFNKVLCLYVHALSHQWTLQGHDT